MAVFGGIAVGAKAEEIEANAEEVADEIESELASADEG